MLNNILFDLLLLFTLICAIQLGDADSRLAAGICVVAALTSLFLVSPLPVRYSGLEAGVLVVDVMTLIGFVSIALQSRHFWPLWVAGLQLTTLLAHLSRGIDSDLVPQAYAAAAVFWSYPILLIVSAGALREYQRRRRSIEV